MKYANSFTIAALVAAATPGIALAVPSAFTSKCGAITIDNQTTSTLMRDTEDCKLIWVLPPGAGMSKVTGFSPSANLGMCREVKSAQGASARVMKRMEETSQQLDDLRPDYERAQKAVVEAKKKLEDTLTRTEIKLLADMQLEVERIEGRIDELLKALETCTEGCDRVRAEYADLGKQRNQLNAEIMKLRREHGDSVRAYDRAKAGLASAETQLEYVGADIEAIMAKQSKYHKDLLDLLLFYSRIEGGTAHLDYNTGWDDNIRTLTADHGNRYQFRKVPTSEARIFANIVGAANESTYLSSMPAILDYSIAGLKYQPFGEERQAEMAALPSRLAGSIRMSLMGGCPIYYKDFLESGTLTPAGTPEQHEFAISASYKYPAAFILKVKASYNLYKFYEKIVESSSSGGFFSSHSSTSITENKVDTDMFSIDWKVEDPDSMYTESKRQEVERALKAELIGRVLGTMAQPVFDKQPNISATAPVNSGHGAVVLADGLQSTCGNVNMWCTAGAWVLRGLDSIFGSDSATSTYRATHNRTASESWSAEASKWVTGATVFTTTK